MFGYEAKDVLAIIVVIVSVAGALVGILLKDFFFSRSVERWKQAQALEQVYRRYRDPLLLSTREVISRTRGLIEDFPASYLCEAVRKSRPVMQVENSVEDAYFMRYKLLSTTYRIAAFFGWLELYRQDITFLPCRTNVQAVALDQLLDPIRSDFADGHLNKAKDWESWADYLIFREELRAIGEAMIEVSNAGRTVIGYGRFCEMLESTELSAMSRWSPLIFSFLFNLQDDGRDFRKTRLKRLFVHFVALANFLDPNRPDPGLTSTAANYSRELYL
jgi:hypothetical protein